MTAAKSVAKASASSSDLDLTDLEANLLGHVLAHEPTTAYEIRRVLERSPVSSFSSSTGSIYPSVKRLVQRGLIIQETVPSPRRGTTHLRATPLGREAVLKWAATVDPFDALPHDPLRGKMILLEALPKADQMRFIILAKRSVEAKLAAVSAYAEANPGVYAEFAYDGARAVLEARRAWLERVLLVIVDL